MDEAKVVELTERLGERETYFIRRVAAKGWQPGFDEIFGDMFMVDSKTINNIRKGVGRPEVLADSEELAKKYRYNRNKRADRKDEKRSFSLRVLEMARERMKGGPSVRG